MLECNLNVFISYRINGKELDYIHSIVSSIYECCSNNTNGKVADYIPELANVNPDFFGISFVIFMERKQILEIRMLILSSNRSKPLTYCLARKQNSNVHNHVGYLMSGRSFNEFVLDDEGKPHNPMINSGAIMTASFIYPDVEPAERFKSVVEFYNELSGKTGRIGFNNSVFLSEKHNADRNLSLAYYMRENSAYQKHPTHSELQEHLDLYFQCCSITINSEIGSIMASTLANGGKCPITNEQVEDNIVKDVLSIMYNCGMYDYSGQFGFEIGLPAKSGVSGVCITCHSGNWRILYLVS